MKYRKSFKFLKGERDRTSAKW